MSTGLSVRGRVSMTKGEHGQEYTLVLVPEQAPAAAAAGVVLGQAAQQPTRRPTLKEVRKAILERRIHIHPSRADTIGAWLSTMLNNIQRAGGLAEGMTGEWSFDAQAKLEAALLTQKLKRQTLQAIEDGQVDAPVPVFEDELVGAEVAVIEAESVDVQEFIDENRDAEAGDGGSDAKSGSSDSSDSSKSGKSDKSDESSKSVPEEPEMGEGMSQQLDDNAVMNHHLYETLSEAFDTAEQKIEAVENELVDKTARIETLVSDCQQYETEIEDLREINGKLLQRLARATEQGSSEDSSSEA
jgi:hypothetical protein